VVERSGQTGHIRDYSVEPHNSISASFRSGWRQRFQGTVEMRSLFRAFVFLRSPGAVALPSSRSRRRPDRKFMSGTITPLASIILSQTRDQLSMSSSIRSRVGAHSFQKHLVVSELLVNPHGLSGTSYGAEKLNGGGGHCQEAFINCERFTFRKPP